MHADFSGEGGTLCSHTVSNFHWNKAEDVIDLLGLGTCPAHVPVPVHPQDPSSELASNLASLVSSPCRVISARVLHEGLSLYLI
jgi:hypothetical protein